MDVRALATRRGIDLPASRSCASWKGEGDRDWLDAGLAEEPCFRLRGSPREACAEARSAKEIVERRDLGSGSGSEYVSGVSAFPSFSEAESSLGMFVVFSVEVGASGP